MVAIQPSYEASATDTDSAKVDLYDGLAVFWALFFCMNVFLLFMFFQRDWALILFLWKIFLSASAVATLVVSITNLATGEIAIENIIVPCVIAAYFCYSLAIVVVLSQYQRCWRQWVQHRPQERLDAFASARRYHDDGYVERDEFRFEQSDLIGCGGAARVYSGEYAGMDIAVKVNIFNSFHYSNDFTLRFDRINIVQCVVYSVTD